MDRPRSKRPNLYIVNLQWTPKDDSATLKINGEFTQNEIEAFDIMRTNLLFLYCDG